MNQTKAARMHPGAFRSCLIPFTDQILDWWYDDLLTAAEIQRRLKAEGLEVARTTVMRFIKVREQRALKRKRPPALRKKNTISAEHSLVSCVCPVSPMVRGITGRFFRRGNGQKMKCRQTMMIARQHFLFIITSLSSLTTLFRPWDQRINQSCRSG